MKDLKINELTAKGFTVNMVANAAGYKQQMNLIQDKLNGMDNASKFHFLEEMYDDNFIFQVGGEGKSTFFKQEYSFNEADGVVEFAGHPMEVQKQITFNSSNNLNLNNMTEKKCCPEKVAALIANEASLFTDSDNDWLSAMTEEQLEKLIPVIPEVVANSLEPGNGSAQDPAKMDRDALKESVTAIFNESKDPEEFINTFIPEGLREQMKSGLEMYKANRTKLIEGIVANSEFKVEALEAWTDADLQTLYTSVSKVDFSGTASPAVNTEGEATPGMEAMFGSKKEEK